MRVLVVGAGAVGGYFGGRLLEKGVDVTFLVRERRKRELEERGLVIRSVHGDAVLAPKLIAAGERTEPFDLVVFSNKAYHLAGAIADAKPYVGETTMILPLLNGMAHMDVVRESFGDDKVLGGLCFIETTLNEKGEIVQTAVVLRAAIENNSLKIFVNHFFASLEKESCILPSCSVQWIVKTCAQRGRKP
ncbi:hypothetical protein L3V64_003480 [Geobacillus stearothermophilus]|uniref:2-dehydropantoate 2-reductase N-terminal domain-containing protein n=1 Tax=Geobacillus stearothermophilus TaxID=1422 RepID=UPI001F3FFBEB|nr:2-dehydropantoate 2-reductase N-terminal domain-containing protein [Geobacillus stearothermophilus]MCK7605433.1 hypothetical protein [Geobacillus stearothermophilus]